MTKETLLLIIQNYGYLALFGALSLGIIGLPIPDETIMTYVGYLVYNGQLSYFVSIAIAITGSLTGMTISYGIGRRYGKNVLLKLGRWVFLSPHKLQRTEAWFLKYGIWTVVIGYFIPGVRHLTSYLAGVSRISFWKYVLFAGLGAILWSGTFITLGLFIGAKWEKVMYQVSHNIVLGIGVLIVISVIGYGLFFRRRKKGKGSS